MTYAEREKQIEELRAKHGAVDVIELRPDEETPADKRQPEDVAPPVVVVRPMELDAFVRLQHDEARRNRGVRFEHPRQITRPLLECVVMGLEEAEVELNDYAGFECELMSCVARLAGAMREDVDVEPLSDPDSKGPIKMRVAGQELEFRRMTGFDYSNARSAIGKHRAGLGTDFVSPIALLEIAKQQAVSPESVTAVIERYPAVVSPLGQLLWYSAASRAQRREGK